MSKRTYFWGICAPWLFVIFTGNPMVILPALSFEVLNEILPSGWNDFIALGDQSIWTGMGQGFVITPLPNAGLSIFYSK